MGRPVTPRQLPAQRVTASRRGRAAAGQAQIFCGFHQWIVASGPGSGIPVELMRSRPRAVRGGAVQRTTMQRETG